MFLVYFYDVTMKYGIDIFATVCELVYWQTIRHQRWYITEDGLLRNEAHIKH